MAVETLILRFRDLSVPKGDTIKRHNKIIDDKGYVWWGWWNKSFEKVPASTFQALNSKETDYEVFLFDAGSLEIYKANCQKISSSQGKEPIISPEEACTPGYYSETGYLAWFKFSKIEKISSSEVMGKYSYMEIKEFYKENVTHYEPFNKKVVISVDELRYQERTIWFIRKCVEADSKTEIILYTPYSSKSEDFIPHTIDTKSNRFLWLSDLHFNFSGGEQAKIKDLTSTDFSDVLDGFVGKNNISFGPVIISGDFTNKSAPEEFDASRRMIDRLRVKHGLKYEHFAFCPGNHDFKFVPTVDKKIVEKFVRRNVDIENTENYKAFYEEIFGKKPNKFFALGRRYLVQGSIPVEVVALNSHVLQQFEGQFRSGYLSSEQLLLVEDRMGWNSSQNLKPFRIVVLHYNVFPVDYNLEHSIEEGINSLIDSEQFIRWLLKNDVKLVLHGHTHQFFHTKIGRSETMDFNDYKEVSIIGMGRTGNETLVTQGSSPNQFATLEFKQDELNVEFFEVRGTDSPKSKKKITVEY